MSRLREWILHSYEVSAAGLALYRMTFASVYLVLLFPRYAWVGRYPDALWNPPPGPFRLLHGFPPTAALSCIEWALAVALVALLLGYRTTMASYAVGILLITGNGFLFSFGRIHHLILAPLAAIILAHSGWGSMWSIDARRGARRRAEAWPVTLTILAAALLMLTSGLPKLHGGWLRPGRHAVVAEVVLHSIGHVPRVPVPSGAGAELLDWATVALEIGFVFAILIPDAGRTFVAVAALFHSAILISLGIDFSSQLLVYAVLLPWTQFAERLSGLESTRGGRAWAVAARHPVIAVAVLVAAYLAVEQRIGPSNPPYAVALFIHVVAAAIGVTYVLNRAAVLARRRPAAAMRD